MTVLEYVNSIMSGMIVPVLLTVAGVYFGVKLKLFHIIHPTYVVKGLRSERSRGGISSAKAVSLALAGTLGVGNIVGVSSAIHMGGFGAVFWMWISALCAMLLKYAEIVLAMRYRSFDKEGRPHGSAMSYMEAFFKSAHLRRIGRAVTFTFAAAFMLNALTMGSMLQSGAIADALSGVVGLPKLYVGLVLATVTLFAARSGARGMSSLTNVLVPIMSVGYISISLIVIIRNGGQIGDAFHQIFACAFSLKTAASGVGGFAFARAVRYGVMRGLISNEAGCGTAPAAHAVADCQSPARQGMWGIFEVFVDTVVLCTMTALCVILEYPEASRFGGNYMMMTISAYASVLGESASYFLCVAVLCFGFATIVCWAHYGLTAMRYFNKSHLANRLFILAYCASVAAGSVVSAELCWQLADLSMGIMTVINITVVSLMSKDVERETVLYLESVKENSRE